MKRTDLQLRHDALAILQSAIRAVDAGNAVRSHLVSRGACLQVGNRELSYALFDHIYLVSVGKASIDMAGAVQDILHDRLTGGIVVTKHGHVTRSLGRLTVFEAGHPIPDQAGLDAAKAIRHLALGLGARDLLIVAISGGASSLLPAPSPPLTLQAKQQTTDLLLGCGAAIEEINAVRKHLSALKGGQLAQLAYPATIVTLMVSDVIGDSHDVIGSGLTSPDPSTFSDALAVLERYGIHEKVPGIVRLHLERGLRGEIPETPKPGAAVFRNVHHLVVASNQLALEAAFKEAEARGYNSHILASNVQGETREAAQAQAQLLRQLIETGNPVPLPACILSGGETTVTLQGSGKGGRNTEFALAAALEIAGIENALILSSGTDGTDGPTDAAGAIATGNTISRAAQIQADAADFLKRNDSYTFFDRLGDLIKTGPTGTNVMDLHLLMAG